MKAVILTALALSILGVVAAQAVIETFYSDSNCATQAGPNVLGQNLSNPLIMPLDQCVRYYMAGINIKFTSCNGSMPSGSLYNAQFCPGTGSRISDISFGSCEPTSNLPGTQSSKMTSTNCAQKAPAQPGVTSKVSAAASVTLAFISVVFSAIALLL
jgi:hypothetical protein